MIRNFCKKVIEEGGTLVPLLIPSSNTGGTGLCNPSIYVDDGKLILNLRHVNYTLYHCEGEQLYNSRYGPLSYLNPENDIHLKTINYHCTLNDDLTIKDYWKVDTSKLDSPTPVWEFWGLEDARLFRWDGRLFMCGCRRDVKPNGESRMELSEIIFEDEKIKEINRYRIEPPKPSYCEKNWMPVLDMPFHFVKWTNPTEVIKVNLDTLTSETVYLGQDIIPNLPDFRGGSQVITWGDYRICLVHEVNLFFNRLEQKDAKYFHRFVVWDKDWNIVKLTDPFSFMTGEIEFAEGMALYNDDLLITFGFQDNAAFILKIPKNIIPSILGINKYKDSLKGLEITTTILEKGCPVNCSFCPQGLISSTYKGQTHLSLDEFKTVIDKLSTDVEIIFAGFAEPFLNKSCADMIVYADSKGFKVSLFTTGNGMTLEDVDKIKGITFATGSNSGFVLHLPDKEGYSKQPLTDNQMDVYKAISNNFLDKDFFSSVSMADVTEKLRKIFPDTYIQEMYSRAGNMELEKLFRPQLSKLNYKSTEPKIVDSTCNFENRNVLLPNGDVVLCCQDYGLKHVLGNLFLGEYMIPLSNTPFELCRKCENGRRCYE
jgi:organic radical activating enzyme